MGESRNLRRKILYERIKVNSVSVMMEVAPINSFRPEFSKGTCLAWLNSFKRYKIFKSPQKLTLIIFPRNIWPILLSLLPLYFPRTMSMRLKSCPFSSFRICHTHFPLSLQHQQINAVNIWTIPAILNFTFLLFILPHQFVSTSFSFLRVNLNPVVNLLFYFETTLCDELEDWRIFETGSRANI